MDINEARQKEIDKYTEIYSRLPNYKTSFRLSQIKEIIDIFDPNSTYLDVGCGRGEAVQYAQEKGLYTRGIEAVKELCTGAVKHGLVHDLPFSNNSFDYVSAFDVMEHLLPGDDALAVQEMARVAKRKVILTIANGKSGKLGYQLHINIRPYEDWDKLLRQWVPDAKVVWLKDLKTSINEVWEICL